MNEASEEPRISQRALVIRNTFYMGVAQVSSRVITALTGIALVRYLGLQSYSDFATALAFTAVFFVVPAWAFNQVFLRACSMDRSKTPGYFGTSWILNILLMLVCWAAALIVGYGLYRFELWLLVFIVGTSTMLQTLRLLFEKVFQIYQRLHLTAIVTVAANLTYSAGLIAAMVLGGNVLTVCIIYLLMNAAGAAVACVLALRMVRPKVQRSAFGPILRQGVSFGLLGGLTGLSFAATSFLLSILRERTQMGYYGSANRLIEGLMMLAHVGIIALRPVLYAMAGDRERLVRAIRQVIRYFVVLSIPMAVLLMGRCEEIIVLLYKAEFRPAATVLGILSLTLAFRFVLVLCDGVLYACGRERLVLVMYATQIALNVSINLILIPRYGATGGAIGALIAQGSYTVAVVLATTRELRTGSMWRLLILPALAGAAMWGVLDLMRPWAVLGALAAVGTFGVLLIAARYYRWSQFKVLLVETLARRRIAAPPAAAPPAAADEPPDQGGPADR